MATRKLITPTDVPIEDPDKNNDLYPPFTVEDAEGKKYGPTFGRLREAVAFARKYVNQTPDSPFLLVQDSRGVRMAGVEPIAGAWSVPTENVGHGIALSYPTYDDPRIVK